MIFLDKHNFVEVGNFNRDQFVSLLADPTNLNIEAVDKVSGNICAL